MGFSYNINKVRSLLFLAMGVLLSSCTPRQARQVFDRAELFIINDFPDSALVVLAEVDTSSLRTRESRARFSLLHTMALYKGLHDDDLSLSAIAPAVNWYSRHGSADDRFLAYYYQGVIHNRKGDIMSAACSFTDAESVKGEIKNKHEQALMFLAFGELYSKTFNTQMELEYTQRALDLLQETGDPLYQRALGELAMAYHSARQWSKADSLYRIAIEANMQVNSRAARVYMCNYAAMKLLEPEKDPSGSIELLDRLRKDFKYSFTPYDAAVYAYALVLVGQKEEARRYLNVLESLDLKDDTRTNTMLFNLYKSEGNYKLSNRYLADAVNSQSGTIESALSDSISRALQDYYREKEERRAKNLSLLIAILQILVAAAAVVILIGYYRRRLNQMEIERLISLLEENDAVGIRHELIEEKIHNIAQESAITDLLWQNQNGLLSSREFLNRLRDKFSSLKAVYGDLNKLERMLNDRLDGIIDHIKKDLDVTDGSDLRFICYTIMQLRPDMVSELLGISVQSVYVKKSRLKKQLLSLGSEHIDEYRILFKEK